MPRKSGFTHESTHDETVEWYTPKYIFDALGMTFDLDVASPGADVVPWIPAHEHLTNEPLRPMTDGLQAPWGGSVWLNPPYDRTITHWVERFCVHGRGIMLVFARTDTAWFQQLASYRPLISLIRGCVQFIRSDMNDRTGATPKVGSSAPSLLAALGDDCQLALYRSRLGSCFVCPSGFENRRQ
jgi:hypothetical protein